jgi:hypothetical protein
MSDAMGIPRDSKVEEFEVEDSSPEADAAPEGGEGLNEPETMNMGGMNMEGMNMEGMNMEGMNMEGMNFDMNSEDMQMKTDL